MSNLVFTKSLRLTDQPYTTADVIAKYTGISHHAINTTINKHLNRLSKSHKVAFEMQALPSGQTAKMYLLNEEQATLLINFLRNTEQVADFKTELVHQFYLLRDDLLKRRVKWENGKAVSKSLGDTIAERNDPGSHAYVNFNNLIYKSALGYNGKQLRVIKSIPSDEAITEYLTTDELTAVERVKNQVITLLEL